MVSASPPAPARPRSAAAEGHFHGTIEVDRGREISVSLLPLSCLGIQRAQAAVAVRLEGAQCQLVGKAEGLVVVLLSRLNRRRITMCMDFAQELRALAWYPRS